MNSVQHVAMPKYCYREMYSITQLTQTLVIRFANYLDLLGPSGKHFLTIYTAYTIYFMD